MTSNQRGEFDWDQEFLSLHSRCLEKYRDGNEDYETYYSDGDLQFLESIGCKEREFFDFVEDYGDYGEPGPGAALLIAEVRREYLREEMGDTKSSKVIEPGDLPSKTDELDGLVWLPRIIVKAKGKLRGELDPEIMFCCGGDRKFLRTHGVAPADFLRAVWKAESAKDEEQALIDYVKSVSQA